MKDDLARILMQEFADSTGVTGHVEPRRYLWTDAFAVCNFLGLYRRTHETQYLERATDLVDQVHHILGRHRQDDSRRGWISGLSDAEGERHPTCGGLRIGKNRNERGPNEPPDPRLEWDQDGQYFHYLTKWMHALACMTRETGETDYLRWAGELAAGAQRAFTFAVSPGGPKRMAWKMSIDLSRPLVPSMGQHDPLDGLVTCLELQTDEQYSSCGGPDLSAAIADFTEMCQSARWTTDDPLGIGGLLDDATRLAQMVFLRGLDRAGLIRRLLRESELSLQAFADSSRLDDPAEYRLAFRELGLSIGLRGLGRIQELAQADPETATAVGRVVRYRPLADAIQDFWSDPAHRRNIAWTDHRDINTVMLATSLAPEGYHNVNRAS